LKLKAYLQDELVRTPPQLERWQIYYTEVPEGALNPQKYFAVTPSSSSIDEGQNFKFEIAFENISNTAFTDSLLVDFFAFSGNNQLVPVISSRYKKLNPGEHFIASGTFNSLGYAGNNSLWIEVNPKEDQPEQYHFNNLANVFFKVNKDITNPVLDVTFDGQHILEGDIVSAKPQILIKLKDENKFIALNDTNKYRVFLTTPDGIQSKLSFENAPGISTDRSKMKYIPASLPDNSFLIEYNPIFETDGIYKIDVQASDEAGNLSGQYNYRISFEVINHSSITEVINYPNPFSTSTRFVFTLTGSEIPTQTKIQILTITGKIVREILQNEIGPVHIGRNITEFAWDGRDQFGDQLANGIYLYRVITNLNGQRIEKRATAADPYFKKGWGKMYLLR
ncbi:MAG: T9SS type A sorting domain-containing protein, partial [Bacteroidia bacterium]|nr:T9SS type A sorting domain-containing protein [Bacteroidia bacterium]